MGTNFYKVLPTPENYLDKVDEIVEDIKRDLVNYQEISYETKEKLENLDKSKRTIHLGKRSYGWQFLWNHNNCDYYDLNIDSIKEFLNQPGHIEDEYGEIFTVEQFLEDEIKKWLWGDDEFHNFTGKSYLEACKKDPETYGRPWYDSTRAVTIKDKTYPVEQHDILINGLRFSTSTEFC